MATGEVMAAMKRMEARKESIDLGAVGESLGEDRARAVLSGLDLEMEEVFAAQMSVGKAFVHGAVSGLDPIHMAAGLWVDGLAAGLLIAEARQREASRS